jgi:hypothetical protein
MKHFNVIVALGLATLAVRAPAAQAQTGTPVTGVVVDSTGGVLPSAQVELKTTTDI